MNLNKDIKTFFIYGNTKIENIYKTDNDLIFGNIEENFLPGILKKTIEGINYCLKNYNFDYLVRTNLSTFWNLNYLCSYFDKLPNKKCLGGVVLKTKFSRGLFVSGTGIFLSNDICKYLVENKQKIDYGTIDDVSISRFIINNLKINFVQIPRNDKYSTSVKNVIDENYLNKNFCSYRIKGPKNRNHEPYKLQRLMNIFYK
jgi:hypothetical protein